MRTKEVNIPESDTPFKISALTVDQVQELVFSDSIVDALKEGGAERAQQVIEGDRNFVKERCAPIVAASLNNIIMGNGEWFQRPEEKWSDPRPNQVGQTGPPRKFWTPDMVTSNFDWLEASTLYVEITKFTGLGGKQETKGGSAIRPSVGESTAAASMSTESSAA